MSDRGLRPAGELSEGRPHGIRLRYIGGCRCDLCRAANRNYERKRLAARKAGDWNGIVSADEARAHLLRLRRLGVGTRSVEACTDIARSILVEIRKGTRKRIRARTARAILAVTPEIARGDRSLVKAGQTWRLVDQLLEEGFTKRRIATELGHSSLQLGREQVTVRNAARVAAVHRRLTT